MRERARTTHAQNDAMCADASEFEGRKGKTEGISLAHDFWLGLALSAHPRGIFLDSKTSSAEGNEKRENDQNLVTSRS
jgi:hypothetical protein